MPPLKKLKTAEGSSKSADVRPKTSSDSDDTEDWREDCFGIRDLNSYALRKNILTDVTFFVGDKKEVFHAHRLILALGSPVFEAMFFGPLAEKGDTVTIPDVDPEGFHYLLRFLYTERVMFRDPIVALKTAFAADKYCMSFLKKKCERYLCSIDVTPANVWIFLQNSIFLNFHSLGLKCNNHLKHSLDSSLQHASFLDVNVKTIETLLSLNGLYVAERKLLQAVIHWARSNSNAEEKDSFKEVITPTLRHIRFSSLTAEDFVHFLEIDGLGDVLTTEDSMAILKHILLPKMCDLPEWCSKRTRLRSRVQPLNEFTPFAVRCLIPRRRDDQTSSPSSSSSSDSSDSSSSSGFDD